jgi:type VI secretion system protein ImpG
MSDELLPYYNRELTYIRKLGAEFAQANPKIAGRLRLGPEVSEDPHVERLIEAFAYLNARTRHKLEDDFPELTEAILGVLYPHYLAPLPSMAIVQFDLDSSQGELTAGYSVPQRRMIETEAIDGEPCRFQTSYPVTLYPVTVQSASLSQPPFVAPTTARSPDAAAVLRLTLTCRSETVSFSDMTMPSLRVFLRGQPQVAYPLYELLLNNTLEVAIANSPTDREAVVLDKNCIQPVGFGLDEAILPYSARSFPGYGLLTEFFAFPEKFLFFDIVGLDSGALSKIGRTLEIFIYLDRTSRDLQRNVIADTFLLGCTPVVNLFTQRADPIQLNHRDFEYRVIPDARRPLSMEIYSIDKVAATSPSGEVVEFMPFYSIKHADQGGKSLYWHGTRRSGGKTSGPADNGTEMYVSLVDLQFKTSAPADWTLDIETTCLNRDLPYRLPFGGDQPRLQLSEGSAGVAKITCLTAPTRTYRPSHRYGALWKIISHLSLNHLSIVGNDTGAEALREILKLYDYSDSEETQAMIAGILRVNTRRIVSRPKGEIAGAFSRGLEVTVHFDESKFTGSGLFLFASVIERFLGLYCTLNSFTKMIATVEGRKKELRRWQPRMGEKVLA